MQSKRVQISPGIVILAAILIYLDGIAFVTQCMCACILHEAGHCIAARMAGNKVQSIRISTVGAEIAFVAGGSFSYFSEVITAFAGPIVNLIAAWTSICLNAYLFAGINLCLGIINLFPIRPLDGGRIVINILSMRWPYAADSVVKYLSIILSGCLLGLGGMAWIKWGNISLLLTSAWVAMGSINEKN